MQNGHQKSAGNGANCRDSRLLALQRQAMARVYTLLHSLVAALGKLWNADKQSPCANAKQSQASNHKMGGGDVHES